MTKNWFIHKVKKNSKKLKKEVSYETLITTGGADTLGASADVDSYLDQREEMEFWTCLLTQVDSWDTGKSKS